MKASKSAKRHAPLVIGNWKMNPNSRKTALSLAQDVKKGTPKKGKALVCIAPPSIFIDEIGKKIAKSRVMLGAQNVHPEKEGAHTGELSLTMLKESGVTFVIAGHSERRAAGETDALVSAKVEAILKGGLTAVACIGERHRDKEGNYFNEVESQLHTLLTTLPKNGVSRLVIAYEPVWAIGSGKTATAEDVQEMKLFIQKVIADTLGRTAVSKIRILYGGSVNKENAQELLEIGQADGFLIGGASLKSAEFTSIIKTADTYAS